MALLLSLALSAYHKPRCFSVRCKSQQYPFGNPQAPAGDELQTHFQYTSDERDHSILSPLSCTAAVARAIFAWGNSTFPKQWKHGKNTGRGAKGTSWNRIFRIYFCVEYLCTHLRPLVCLRVISFNGTEIHLSVITANGKETVPKETNANCVSADAHWGDGCPHICLWVIPACRQHPRVCREKEAEACLLGKTPSLKIASRYQHNDQAPTVRPLIWLVCFFGFFFWVFLLLISIACVDSPLHAVT